MKNLSLYYFIVVAEEMSFTKAANRLFISQQALSEQIKKLEHQFNAVFFERGSQLKLTYQGERMLIYSHKVLDAEQDLVNNLKDHSTSLDRYRLSVGITSVRGTVVIPKIVSSYQSLYPNVIVSIVPGSQKALYSQLHQRKIDLYMGMLDNINSGDSTIELYKDELFFIISRELLEKHEPGFSNKFIEDHKHGVKIAEVCQFPTSLPPMYSMLRIIMERLLSENSVTPNIVMETTNHDIIFDLCQMGKCCGFISREVLYKKLIHKSLPPNVCFFRTSDMLELSYFGIVYDKKNLHDYMSQFFVCCKKASDELIHEIDHYLAHL